MIDNIQTRNRGLRPGGSSGDAFNQLRDARPDARTGRSRISLENAQGARLRRIGEFKAGDPAREDSNNSPTDTSSTEAISDNRLAPTRLAPRSYFCIC